MDQTIAAARDLICILMTTVDQLRVTPCYCRNGGGLLMHGVCVGVSDDDGDGGVSDGSERFR
ncbi:hypothetical protein HanIR_Chr02g0059331 [Helianthus annuus]|nr:hypothetical protein HanIR_Chr02g0059331 [Helianthus annuus]